MNKRSIAKLFNQAPKGVWTTITTDPVRLSEASFNNTEESREQINELVNQYINKYLTKAVQKKIPGLRAIVDWSNNGAPLDRPAVAYMEVFRLGTKFVLILHVM
jgi:hypothetical protein